MLWLIRGIAVVEVECVGKKMEDGGMKSKKTDRK